MRRREFISAAALLPLAARAQPSSKVHRLGYLSATRIPNVIEALQTGLRELGYVEGKNLKVEYRFGGQQSQRLHAIASEPVELRPDAIVTAGTSAVFAAKRHRVPAIHEMREFVKDGGLISYGPKITEVIRRSATFVDKILKGIKPADLPIEQPKKFELVINLETAKALDLTVPPLLLARGNERSNDAASMLGWRRFTCELRPPLSCRRLQSRNPSECIVVRLTATISYKAIAGELGPEHNFNAGHG